MSQKLELKQLLEAGAHFGHQVHKWNPKMKPYIFGERSGVYVIDLGKTIPLAKKAYDFLEKVASSGRSVLFVGTKRQACDVIRESAKSCGAFHVTNRWLGGMLTNYKTIALSVDKLRKVEKMKENGDFNLLTKKEQAKIGKEVAKLEKNLGGIKNMRKLPGAIVVIDPSAEKIAVKEANLLNIPVVGLVDTNCDPDGIDYIVPANDDAIKSITLFSEYFSSAVAAGSKKSKKSDGNAPETVDRSLEKEIIEKYEQDIELKQD